MEAASKLTVLTEFRRSHEPPLSMEAAGELVGVSKAAWSRWESGQRKIDPDLVPLVSEKTGIAPALLRSDLAETFGEVV